MRFRIITSYLEAHEVNLKLYVQTVHIKPTYLDITELPMTCDPSKKARWYMSDLPPPPNLVLQPQNQTENEKKTKQRESENEYTPSEQSGSTSDSRHGTTGSNPDLPAYQNPKSPQPDDPCLGGPESASNSRVMSTWAAKT